MKIDRNTAENMYADMIVNHGNPHYFILRALAEMSDEELQTIYNDHQKHFQLDNDPIEIVEEE